MSFSYSSSSKMCAKKILYELSMERFKVFQSQDPENEDMDVVFELDGKKLYANKFTLRSISSTFQSMLSKRWKKSDEAVKIEGYTFDDFKEFLTFIFSGACELTNDNIFAMVDIAEFYAVKVFKKYCEEYLIEMVSLQNVNQMLELGEKYSLEELKQHVSKFISRDLPSFLQSEQFCQLSARFFTQIVQSNKKTPFQEDFFKAIYEWAATRAMELQNDDSNAFDYYDAIKKQLSDILPLIIFKIMDQLFLDTFVAKKYFLFTEEQFKNIGFPIQNQVHGKLIYHLILSKDDISSFDKTFLYTCYNVKTNILVQVSNTDGRIMKGCLHCPNIEKVVYIIESLKDVGSKSMQSFQCFWKKNSQNHQLEVN